MMRFAAIDASGESRPTRCLSAPLFGLAPIDLKIFLEKRCSLFFLLFTHISDMSPIASIVNPLSSRGFPTSPIVPIAPATLSLSNTGNKTLFASWAASNDLEIKFPSTNISGVFPLTVFRSTLATATCEWVKDQVKIFEEMDDVFDQVFL